MVVTTITALRLNNMTTVAIMTVVVDLLALAPESSSLASSSQTTPADGPVTDPATGENGMYKPRPVLGTSAGAASNFSSEPSSSESSGATQAWIAGPVIGAIVVLVALAGAYIFFVRRRKQSRSESHENSETWRGKPELHAESVPGLAKSLVEADGLPRPPQELEGEPFEPYSHEIGDQNYGAEDQHANPRRAEMAANEVAAGEMDVRAVNWHTQTKSDGNRQ
jgi:hypothetical protein